MSQKGSGITTIWEELEPEELSDEEVRNCSGSRSERSVYSHASILSDNFLGSIGIFPVKVARGWAAAE